MFWDYWQYAFASIECFYFLIRVLIGIVIVSVNVQFDGLYISKILICFQVVLFFAKVRKIMKNTTLRIGLASTALILWFL